MQQNIISETWRPKLFSLLHIVSDYLAILLAEKTALFLQGIFRVQASQMMILPWDYQYIYIPGMFLLLSVKAINSIGHLWRWLEM